MRTGSILAARLAVVLAACATLVALPAAASASPQSEQFAYSTTTFGDRLDVGVSTTVAEQYRLSRAHRGRGAQLKQQFLKSAAANGHFYDADDIDYLLFARPDGISAEVVVPRNYRIDTVEIAVMRHASGKHGVISAAAQGGESDPGEGPFAPTGPGFDNFSFVNGNEYHLRVNACKFGSCQTRSGKLDFYWSKYKDKGETNTSVDVWAYKRWAVATTMLYGGSEYWVETMGMRSYPTSSSRNILRGWNGMSPLPGQHSGNCSGSLSVAVANVSASFTPCESYRIDWNSNSADAGDMSFNWSNSYYFPTKGTQSMAAVFSAKSAQGTQPYYKDFIKLDLYGFPRECAATDGDATCNNNG